MFFNVLSILANQGNNVQVQYRVAERNDQKHAQWSFFREGDTGSLVTDQFWYKMVDSICGYTAVLPATAEYQNGIAGAGGEPDAEQSGHGTVRDGSVEGTALMPDPVKLDVQEVADVPVTVISSSLTAPGTGALNLTMTCAGPGGLATSA